MHHGGDVDADAAAGVGELDLAWVGVGVGVGVGFGALDLAIGAAEEGVGLGLGIGLESGPTVAAAEEGVGHDDEARRRATRHLERHLVRGRARARARGRVRVKARGRVRVRVRVRSGLASHRGLPPPQRALLTYLPAYYLLLTAYLARSVRELLEDNTRVHDRHLVRGRGRVRVRARVRVSVDGRELVHEQRLLITYLPSYYYPLTSSTLRTTSPTSRPQVCAGRPGSSSMMTTPG